MGLHSPNAVQDNAIAEAVAMVSAAAKSSTDLNLGYGEIIFIPQKFIICTKEEKEMAKSFGLQWHLTNECDQRCQHCYIWQKHEKEGLRSTPTIEQCRMVISDFISFCDEMNVLPHLSITGGDPLLYPLIWDVLELIRQKGVSFTILGNPFHLNSEIAKKLKDLGCVSYQMSIDGLAKTHDSLRKRGSFNATISALPVLHNAGIRSMIMATVSLLNYKELPAIARPRLCVEHKVGNFAFSRYCPI